MTSKLHHNINKICTHFKLHQPTCTIKCTLTVIIRWEERWISLFRILRSNLTNIRINRLPLLLGDWRKLLLICWRVLIVLGRNCWKYCVIVGRLWKITIMIGNSNLSPRKKFSLKRGLSKQKSLKKSPKQLNLFTVCSKRQILRKF